MNKITNLKYGLVESSNVIEAMPPQKSILSHCMDIFGALIAILICVGAFGLMVFGLFIAPWM